MLSPTYEITTALSHTDELIGPPYDIAIVTISYGRVIMSSVWDSMMSKKNVGWPFYAAVLIEGSLMITFPFDSCRLSQYEQLLTGCLCVVWGSLNTLRPRQNGRHFADDTFKRIFLNDNVRISIKISLKFVPKGPIINIPALVQIMTWRRLGDMPLSEPMLVS